MNQAMLNQKINPFKNFKRSSIFKLIAAIAIDLGKFSLNKYLGLIIPSLQRETLSDQTSSQI